MPADTAQEATMTDPIKLAREVMKYYEDHMCEGFCQDLPSRSTYTPEMDMNCSGCRARTALAALDAIPQPAPVPGDVELDALQEGLECGVRSAGMHDDNDTELFHVEDASDTMVEAAAALSALRTRLAEVEGALTGMVKIVEGIDGAMNHGTWRDDKGMRLKDTPEWVALYLAAHRKLKEK